MILQRHFANWLVAVSCLFYVGVASAQCTTGGSFGGATIATDGIEVGFAGFNCYFAGEFAPVSLAGAGDFEFRSAIATDFITLTSADGLTVLASGTTPLAYTAAAAEAVRVYVHLDAACGTASVCRALTGICTSCIPPPPPANDLCANAEVVTAGLVSGTTVQATNTLTTTCGTTNTAPEVFYSYTPAEDGLAVFSLCGSSYDTKISVFTGACGALECVGGNDDACGLQSEFETLVTAGTTYTIVVHGFSQATGSFDLEIAFSSCADPEILHPDLTFGTVTLVAGEDFQNGDTYTDIGGPCENYGDAVAASTLELCAAGPGQVVIVTFESFDLEDGFDFLTVAGDAGGNDGDYTGSDNPGTFTSADGGCLSFTLATDFVATEAGWIATVSLEGEPTILPDPIYVVDLATITTINRTLNDDCQALLTARQTLTGDWDVDGDGNEPPADQFQIIVQDGVDNGPIIDGCGRYIYTVSTIDEEPDTTFGFRDELDVFGPNWGFFLGTAPGAPFDPSSQALEFTISEDSETLNIATIGDNFSPGGNNLFQGIAELTITEPGTLSFDYSFNGADPGFDFVFALYNFDGGMMEDVVIPVTTLAGVGTVILDAEPGDQLVLVLQDDGFAPGLNNFTFSEFSITNMQFVRSVFQSDVEGYVTGWGYVNAEDKTSPEFTVEPTAPAQLYCTDIDLVDVNLLASDISRCWIVDAKTGATQAGTMSPFLRARLIAGGGIPTVIDGCSDVEICVNDILTAGDACEDVVIERIFTARDGLTCGAVSGEANAPTVYSYDIIFTKPGLDDVVGVPEQAEFSCVAFSAADPNPQPVNSDYPFILRGNTRVYLGQAFCNLGAAFEDSPRVITCENTYKFVRTYTVIDWCDISRTRTFTQTVKVGDFVAPVLDVIQLDADFDGVGDGLPLVYTTNSNDCSAFINFFAQLSVTDNCDATPTLSAFVYPGGDLTGAPLGPFFPGALAGGFPVGSHIVRFVAVDNCENEATLDVPFRVRDMTAPIAICEDGLNISVQSNGVAELCAEDINRASYDDCTDITLHIAEVNNNNAPIGGINAWTDCLDLTCADLGTLRVGLRVRDENGNTNFCWLDVLIEDKINPVCIAPVPVTLICDELIGTFPANVQDAFAADQVGTAALLDDLFGAPTGLDNCGGATVTQTVADQRNNCGLGRIVRTFRVRDLQGLLSPNCTQIVTILGNHDYSIMLPADTEAICMDADYNDVTFVENGCDLINISTTIDTFQATADECYKLRITYEILNWCEWNGEDDGYVIPRSAVDVNEPTWLHVVPRVRTTLTDDLAFLDRDSDPENGLPSFITNLDTGDGGIVDGTNAGGYGVDRSRGSFIYRQFVKVYDEVPPVITVNTPDGPFCDLDGDCVANADLTFTVTDDCNQASVSATAFLDAFRDAGADGIYTLADFPATEDAINVTALIGRLPDGTFTISLEDLPFGEHAVRISATDGCGNTSVSLLLFEIADCKAPTPICINGLTVTLMPDGNGGGMGDIWASDFIASPSTDCSGEVQYALYGPDEYSVDGFAPAVGDTGLILTCADLGMVIVRIYAIDPAGRADYCETTLFVQAFQPSVCTSGSGSLAGAITTPNAQGMDNVEVNIAGGSAANMAMTQNGGFYAFNSLDEGADYTVQPAYDPAVNLATVSTADLIMISRHILGVQTMNGQYQLLAADVTQDANVNVLDIIAIRRVILGIDAAFSQTPSWKFYHGGNAEVYNVNNLVGAITNADFVAVEMGNVTDAIANAQTATGRGVETIQVEDIQVVAGNTYAVAFEAADLAGFQATIELTAGLELVGVDFASEQATGFNLTQAAEGLIAVSHMGEGAFTLELRATTDGQLSELLKLSNRITNSEAYPANGGIANLNLGFTTVAAGADFALEQNTPNPFADVTKIGFNLPVASEVSLMVQDIQGRTILARQIEGVAGYNTTNINVAELKGATGVMTYTIVAGDYTATRKMVVVR